MWGTMKLHKMRGEEIDEVALLLAEGFMDDPLFVYFFPNPQTRCKKAQSFFKTELSLCKAFTYYMDDKRGVIVMKTPTDKRAKIYPLASIGLFFEVGIISILKAMRFLYFNNKIKRKHLRDGMNQLLLVCVRTDARGKGLAKHMIDEMCVESTYVETQNPLNVGFYTKIGFSLLA
jgi:ribosomal protein S18 acetylase RimI-like enzyme